MAPTGDDSTSNPEDREALVALADVELHCGDGVVKAHSHLLAASSPFFLGLLQGTRDKAIKVPECSQKQWALVTAWMQGALDGRSWAPADLEQAMDLLPLVHEYNFPGLLAVLDKSITAFVSPAWTLDRSSPSYVLRWLAYADQWHLPTLSSSGVAFISSSRYKPPIGHDYAQGTHDMATLPAGAVNYHYSFRCMLRKGCITDDLSKLLPTTLVKVMQAGLTSAGCEICSGPGKFDCLCQPGTVASGAYGKRYLEGCQCKTRSWCSKCTGWLDA